MSTSAAISGYGLTAALPPGWEGRITTLSPVTPAPALDRVVAAARSQIGSATASIGQAPRSPIAEITMPFLHLANFALPPRRGNFGSGAVELMSGDNVLIVLIEYSPDSLGTALFASSPMPRVLYPRMFDPRALQRILPGQGGYQAFFNEAGRAFSLYVVLGTLARATTTVPKTNGVLSGLRIDPA